MNFSNSPSLERMSSPKVAVLLATHNGMPYLEEQVASIFAQLNVEITLFVSDDMSTDGTLEFLGGVKDKQIVMLPRKRVGSGANNFFRLICDAEIDQFLYVALSDQDDVWAPRKLDRAISQIEKYHCGGYSSDLIAFDENNHNVWYMPKSSEPKEFDYLFQGASAGCTYVLTREAALIVRNKIHPTLNSLPLNNSHDWLIYAICRSHGLGWHLDRQAHIYYRQHSRNSYGALPGYRGFIARFLLSRNGWYRQHIVWLGSFLIKSKGEMIILVAVDRLGFMDRFFLAFRVNEFRRRNIDRFLLFFAILTGFL